MELFEAIKARASVRAFQEKAIPDHIVTEMLEAARLSPSGGNGQDYRFGIISDTDKKETLAQAAGVQMWIAEAPLIIACCADISWDLRNQPDDDFGVIVNKLRFGDDFIKYLNEYPDRRRVMSLFANATPLIPAEHMFLTAVSHGLSACFIGFLDTEKASRILELPEHMICLFLLPVGYPKGDIMSKEKKAMDEMRFYNTWEGRV